MTHDCNTPALTRWLPGAPRLYSLAPVLLVLVLAAAIFSDGVLPATWTKAILALGLPLDIAAALWLTRARD
jgi:hypothetical protein